jgi:hypothetical protein
MIVAENRREFNEKTKGAPAIFERGRKRTTPCFVIDISSACYYH